MSNEIVVERQGDVQVIRINRAAKKNSLTRAMYETMTMHELEDHLSHAWVRHDVPHPIRSQVWMYTEVGDRA